MAPIRALVEMVPGRSHHPEAVAGILRQLSRPAPEGQVHVLATLDGCVAPAHSWLPRAGKTTFEKVCRAARYMSS
jgi:hypothetical protein